LATFALGAALPATAAEISVGAGPACTVHTIPDAVALAAATPDIDTIRVADDQAYPGQTLFIGTSVNLIGGHAACGDTAPSGRTQLVGTGEWATLTVSGDPAPGGIVVRLEHLDISGGGASGEFGSWGGISIYGHTLVSIADAVIHHNHSQFGGGMLVSGSNAIVEFERDVDVHDNAAAIGGGIHVEGGSLRIRPQSIAIHDNTAQNGGGLAVLAGGGVSVSTDPDDPATPVNGVLINANQANLGGGVYVAGQNSHLLADDTVVRDNSAAEGGGVYADAGGYAQFAKFREGPFRHCPDELECLRLSGNVAERGGALSVRAGGSAHLDETIVRDNAAGGGSAIWLHGDASSLRIYASLVEGNTCIEGAPGCATIYTSGGSLRFEHSTFADNGGSASLIWGDGAQGAIITDIQGYSSLVSGKVKIFDFLGALPTVHYDCILKDQGGFEFAATRSDVQPMSFQKPALGDYRLQPGSLAIDFCDGTPVSSQAPDLDGLRRGLDDANHADRFGTFDIGAFEADRIFATGTESKR
jgi:hypothetical protein